MERTFFLQFSDSLYSHDIVHNIFYLFYLSLLDLVAGGGSPGDCDFSVAGEVCTEKTTCEGTKPNIDPSEDPEYKSFKELYSCIEDKCIIQMSACEADPTCTTCCKC